MARFIGEMTWPKFLVGYALLLVTLTGVSIWGEQRFHVDGNRIIMAEGALLFAVAAVGRPQVVYLIVRNTGWFAAIESDRNMRLLLAVIAAALAVSALVSR